jgi:hypothetical protein
MENNPMRMKLFKRIGKQSGKMETFQSKWKTIRRNRNIQTGSETIRRNKKISNEMENNPMRMKLFKRTGKQSEEIKNFQTN